MCYHRITLALRYQLQALHRAQQSHSAIAKQLGIHQTSIRRELARVDPYDADSAHQHAVTAQARRHGPRLSHEVWEGVVDDLRAFHSPEQIRGRAQMEGQVCPSIERIYQYVYAHPNLVQYLRQGRPKRRSHTARLAPTLWASITERPEGFLHPFGATSLAGAEMLQHGLPHELRRGILASPSLTGNALQMGSQAS